jgi:hypothetical protein
MDPTLTLTLPLFFLGRTSILPPSPTTLLSTLQNFCPTIDIRLATNATSAPPLATTWTLSACGPDLTDAEKKLVPDGIWGVPVTFERRNIPINKAAMAWNVFAQEANAIFKHIAQLNAMTQPIPGQTGDQRWWSIVAPSSSLCTLTLVPAAHASLPAQLAHNALVVFAAVERELTLLTTPSALRSFWPLSRFLEYTAVRRMGSEKAALWKDVARARRRASTLRSRRAKWLAGCADDEDGFQRTRGRARECADVLAACDTVELMRGLAAFEARMGVEVRLADDDDAHVEALCLPSHSSTTHLPHITAYVSLVSALLNLASSQSAASLSVWLEAHRGSAPQEPVEAFRYLLTALGVGAQDAQFWAEYLVPTSSLSSWVVGDATAALSSSPFDALSAHLAQHALAQRAQIHAFIARYDSVGGFLPTPGKKVYALLLADEHARRDMSVTRRAKDTTEWLGGVKEKVRVADAWEGEDPAMEKGRRSPELDAGGRLRRDRAVRMALER